jgi:hypothetical protein
VISAAIRRGRAVLAFLLCVPFLFLFTRLPSPELVPECLTHVTIAHWAHFVHVCDSYSYAQTMLELDRYFTQPNQFGARPVYIVGGEGVAAVFRPAALLIRSLLIDGHIGGDFATSRVAEGINSVDFFMTRFPEYFALMLVNFAVLGAAIWMAMRLIDPSEYLLAAALGATVATCDLVHGLFWTQHPNFLNIIVPLGCITYFVAGCRARQMKQKSIAAIGLAAGVGSLAYGYIIIWLPMFVFGSFYRDLRMAVTPTEMLRGLLRTLVPLATAGCGPPVVWLASNELGLHGMMNYEAEIYRQFVWLADAWREGRLGAALAEHWNGYLLRQWNWLGWPAPLSLATIALFIWLGHRDWPLRQALLDPILVGVGLTIIAMLIFNFLQGYEKPRLVNGITLALFVALGRTAQKARCSKIGAGVLLAIAGTQIVYAFVEPPISLT